MLRSLCIFFYMASSVSIAMKLKPALQEDFRGIHYVHSDETILIKYEKNKRFFCEDIVEVSDHSITIDSSGSRSTNCRESGSSESLSAKNSSLDLVLLECKSLCSSKKHSELVDYSNVHLKNYPKSLELLLYNAIALQNIGKCEDAVYKYDGVLEIDNTNVIALKNKSDCLRKLNKFGNAIDVYNKILDINPNDLESVCNKCICLEELKKYKEAIELYDNVLKINPNLVAALVGKGYSFQCIDLYEEAVKCFDQVLKIDPKDVYTLNNKGFCLENLKKYQEAIFFMIKH